MPRPTYPKEPCPTCSKPVEIIPTEFGLFVRKHFPPEAAGKAIGRKFCPASDAPFEPPVETLPALRPDAGEPGPHHVDGPNAEPDGEPDPAAVEIIEPEEDDAPNPFDIALARPSDLAERAKGYRPAVQTDADGAIDKITATASEAVAKLPERIDPDEAVRLVMLFDARESAFQEAGHLQRFLLGIVARRIAEASKYGDRAMERLAEATGVNKNVVRQTRRLAERYRDSPEQFTRWLKAIRRETGRPARWTQVERLIGTFSDPTVLGPEELARRVASSVERAAENVGLLAGHESEEGIAVVISDAARTLRTEGMARLAEAEDAPADATPRDPIFLRFVSKLPCAATKLSPPEGGWEPTTVGNDAHHVGPGGTAIKGSDYTAVPLCREAHDFLHAHGYRAFRAKYDVDLLEALFQTLHLYVTEQEARLPAGLLGARAASLPDR